MPLVSLLRIACAIVVQLLCTAQAKVAIMLSRCSVLPIVALEALPKLLKDVPWLVGGTGASCVLRVFCVQHTSHVRSSEVVCIYKVWKMLTLSF